MMRNKRMALMPWAAALVGVVLVFGAVAAQDDEAAVESMAPMESTAPMESMAPLESMAPGLHVRDAWTRESPMVDLAGAAFMVIHNNTDLDDAVVGATSPAAGVVEIHQTSMAEDGTMAMAPVTEIPIPAHTDAVLEPGGYHIMLIQLVEPLVEGEQIELTLEFADAASQTVLVPVQAIGPMDTDMGDMDMGMGDSDEDEDGEAEETEG